MHPDAAPPLSVVSDEARRMTSCPSEARDIRRRQLSQLRVILRVPEELSLKRELSVGASLFISWTDLIDETPLRMYWDFQKS